jgi:hypothetical protein
LNHGRRKDVATPELVTTSPPPGPRVAPLAVAFADVAFLHWRYEPDEVRPLLPPATAPDSIDSAAYVGLVAFRMRSYGQFLEFNVRTYSVDEQGRRGVVFLTMEADRLPWVLVARAAGLPSPQTEDRVLQRRTTLRNEEPVYLTSGTSVLIRPYSSTDSTHIPAELRIGISGELCCL